MNNKNWNLPWPKLDQKNETETDRRWAEQVHRNHLAAPIGLREETRQRCPICGERVASRHIWWG